MDYRDKCNAVHLLEMIVSRDAEILDGMIPEYTCINTLIEAIWNHGMYEVMTQILQSQDQKKKDMPGFEGTEDALEQLSHCFKTGMTYDPNARMPAELDPRRCGASLFDRMAPVGRQEMPRRNGRALRMDG